MSTLFPSSNVTSLLTTKCIAQGCSGAWVVRRGSLYGMIIAGYGNEPYAHMIPAYQLLSDVKSSLSGRRTVDIRPFDPEFPSFRSDSTSISSTHAESAQTSMAEPGFHPVSPPKLVQGNFEPAYDEVEDLHTDWNVPSNCWDTFASLRFSKRSCFFDGLEEPEQQLIWEKCRRIEFLRRACQETRLYPSDHTPLASMLREARVDWNMAAFDRSKHESMDRTLRMDERSRQILAQVRRRGGSTTRGKQILPIPSGQEKLDSVSENSSHTYCGHNVQLVALREDGKGIDDPLFHGHFPDQKMPIESLLENGYLTLMPRTQEAESFRYFHLPANNLKWVEVGPVTPGICFNRQ